jgi:hypothetical protein
MSPGALGPDTMATQVQQLQAGEELQALRQSLGALGHDVIALQAQPLQAGEELQARRWMTFARMNDLN